MEASLYLHVPFCAGACDYCDFYSVSCSSDDSRLDRFIEVLLQDVEKSIQMHAPLRVPSLYIGGGTPSLLGSRRVERLLAGLRGLLPAHRRETTVEANPESATADFIRACDASGVSRLSLGVQSLGEASRKAVGRLGDARSVMRAVDDVRRFFGGSLSLDFISGLPLQTERSLLNDLRFASDAGADHVSLYALTLEDSTPLALRVRKDPRLLPPPEEADDLWIAGRDALESLGYRQYEVSNFSRPGKESLHNRRYWRMESYLGCGPGAVGTVVDESNATALRHVWAPDLTSWLASSGSSHQAEYESISRDDFMAENIIMGFRTREGLDSNLFRARFGSSVEDRVGGTLDKWRRLGLAERDRPALNAEGLLRLNGFLVSCLEELDAKRA